MIAHMLRKCYVSVKTSCIECSCLRAHSSKADSRWSGGQLAWKVGRRRTPSRWHKGRSAMEHRQTEKHTDNNTNNSNAMSRTKQIDRNRTETADLISSFFSRSSSNEQTMSDATTMVDNETMTLANAVRCGSTPRVEPSRETRFAMNDVGGGETLPVDEPRRRQQILQASRLAILT